MTLAGLQALYSGLLQAVPALAAFGVPLVADPATDEKTFADAISGRLRDPGVCLLVGYPLAGSVEAPGRNTAVLTAEVEIFIAESLLVAHSPTGLALVDTAMRAILADRSVRHLAYLTSFDVGAEHGYVYHVFGVALPLALA